MEPLPAPLLRRQTETDPLHGAVGEALHDATVTLWRDLWARLDEYRAVWVEIHSILDVLERAVDELHDARGGLPTKNKRAIARVRTQRLRARLAQVRAQVPVVDEEPDG